ncbi:DNA polymerase [Acidiphilium acidophilum]|uniref:DNA polymerase n=1 Tax=Acidiphilium acidophilum TaxID=76588 RepID=UPI002E8E673A|nr:DNA polymerase [Acidiphilium acidophilum]
MGFLSKHLSRQGLPAIDAAVADLAPSVITTIIEPPQPVARPAAPPSTPLIILDRFAGPDDLEALLPALSAAIEISLDLETTHLTPWLAPNSFSKSFKIGGRTTRAKYQADHPGCTIDATPRARILALETDNGVICAIDLDLLTPPQKRDLIAAIARPDAIWVGHNLGFDLSWLNHISPGAKPGRIIDTMLLATACRPDLEYEIIARVARSGDAPTGITGDLKAKIEKRAQGKESRDQNSAGSLSLDLLSMHLLSEKLDKACQAPQNWMPSYLSPGHLSYCLGDIKAPRLLARRMLGIRGDLDTPISAVIDAIDKHAGGPAYRIFERAIPRLVQMQHTGLRIDPEASAEYRQRLIDETRPAVDHLITLAPELAPFAAQLGDPDQGLTEDLKAAIDASFIARTGRGLPKTDAGNASTTIKALKMEFPGEPLVDALATAQAGGKKISMLDDYLALADANHRTHPLTSIGTVTGRTTSQKPNLQNMPKDKEFRGIFTAALGYKIIASDYSAVEMRIAACLAERNYARFVKSGLAIPDWITKSAPPPFSKIMAAIRAGTPATPLLPTTWPLPEPNRDTCKIGDWAIYYATRYAVVLCRLQAAGMRLKDGFIMSDIEKMALPSAIKNRIDPHLVTALQLEARAGRFDLEGHSRSLDYVTSLSLDQRAALKNKMSKKRGEAKAPNFGLLYGMAAPGLHTYGITTYGLSWSLDDATAARAGWFELYPEIDLWHLQSKLVSREKAPVFKYKKLVGMNDGGKLYHGSTLSGRPVCGAEMRDACNYSDQGTGAEIALDAMARFPDWLAACLVNFVHDEFVFEVPDHDVDRAIVELEAAMMAAGDAALDRFGIPCELETTTGDHWIH